MHKQRLPVHERLLGAELYVDVGDSKLSERLRVQWIIDAFIDILECEWNSGLRVVSAISYL